MAYNRRRTGRTRRKYKEGRPRKYHIGDNYTNKHGIFGNISYNRMRSRRTGRTGKNGRTRRK